jgi:hypothetical protein
LPCIDDDTPYGPTHIEVDGDTTRVRQGQDGTADFRTFATKIDEGIYFISWLGDLGGNHIVVNRQSMKVFRHISPSGERAETIYGLTFFDSAN